MQQQPDRLLDLNGVREIIPFSRQHIHNLVKAGRFPKPHKLNNVPQAHNYWWESDIREFVEERANAN